MRRWIPLLAVVVFAAGLSWALVGQSVTPKTLARFVTPLEGRMDNQRHNAVLCLKQLEGIVIQPGETFSFNEAVGTWSRDKGYRRAPVSFGGLLVDSWGGGVCQTSSTLYNAALLSGLDIVERHRHHYAPTYVAPGRDAAVAYPNIDLKFRNPYDFPIEIHGAVTAAGVRIDLVGSGEASKGMRIEQRVANVTPPAEMLIGSGRYGRVRNPGHTGFSVDTYRIISGVRELVSSDEYPVMNKIIEHKGE